MTEPIFVRRCAGTLRPCHEPAAAVVERLTVARIVCKPCALVLVGNGWTRVYRDDGHPLSPEDVIALARGPQFCARVLAGKPWPCYLDAGHKGDCSFAPLASEVAALQRATEPRKVRDRALWLALDVLSDGHEVIEAPDGRKWLPCGSQADPCPDFACVQVGMNVVSTLCGDCDARRLSGVEPCACDCSPCSEPNHERNAMAGCCARERAARIALEDAASDDVIARRKAGGR